MQTTPLPLSERAVFIFFCQNCWAMFWNDWKINFPIFGSFSFWVMVEFLVKVLRKLNNFEFKISHISKVKIGKLIFHFFLAHSASLIHFDHFDTPLKNDFFYCPKRYLLFWNGFLVVEFWLILYFNFIVHSGLNEFRKISMLGGSLPLNQPFLWVASPPTPPTGGSASRLRMLLEWIPLANWLSSITG